MRQLSSYHFCSGEWSGADGDCCSPCRSWSPSRPSATTSFASSPLARCSAHSSVAPPARITCRAGNIYSRHQTLPATHRQVTDLSCATPGTPVAKVLTQSQTSVIDPTHNRKESSMNWDRVEGNWKQMTGKVKEQWGKLTDDTLTQIGGQRDQLVGKIQEAYGISRDEADKQVKDWEKLN